jgi:cytochrome c-type biogenesis protein CcmH/NrfG
MAHAAPKKRGPPRDPWSGVPEELRAMRDSIAAGSRGTKRSIEALRRFSSGNPDEVHGHLLLAGIYMNRGWSLDALDQYDLAYQKDPSSRGAPEMLNNALKLVVDDLASSDAERFIQRTFQKEAAAAIDKALRAPGLTPAAGARLKKLKSRLAMRSN